MAQIHKLPHALDDSELLALILGDAARSPIAATKAERAERYARLAAEGRARFAAKESAARCAARRSLFKIV